MKNTAVILLAFGACIPKTHAGMLDDVGECLQKSVELQYVSAKAAAAIADMLADPVLGLCVSQVLLPDPLTIAGSGAVVAVAAATGITPGQCENGLRDQAFDPLIDGLSSITGLKRDQKPLAALLEEGKAQAWSYLSGTPPTALLWAKLSCGCTFYDKGAMIKDIEQVAQATTAAGQSCGKVLQTVAGPVGKALGKAGQQVACAMQKTDEAINSDTRISPADYYQTRWRPYEQGYVYLNLKGKTQTNTPLPAGLQFGDEAAEAVFKAYGKLQTDYQNAGTPQSLDQLRNATAAYYECVGQGDVAGQGKKDVIVNQIATTFYQSADARLAVAKTWMTFKQAAQAARAQKETVYLDPYRNGPVSVVTLNQIEALLNKWTDAAWGALQGSPGAKPDDALALTFSEFKPKLDELAKSAQADIQAAKNKTLVAPLRRLAADGNLEKLDQLGEAGLCGSMHPLLMAACKQDTDKVRETARAVLKQRDNKKNWSQMEGFNYGKADGTKQLTANTRYTYKPTIDDPRDDAAWADNAKYNAVLGADLKLRESFIAQLKDKAAPYPALQTRLEGLLDVYQLGCGSAIGQPGGAPTPLCRETLANSIAACLVDAQRKGVPASGTPASQSAGSGAAVGLQAAKASTANAMAIASATVPGPLGKPSAAPSLQCDDAAKAALDRYAKLHHQAPAKDRPAMQFFQGTVSGASPAGGATVSPAIGAPRKLPVQPAASRTDGADAPMPGSLRLAPPGRLEPPGRADTQPPTGNPERDTGQRLRRPLAPPPANMENPPARDPGVRSALPPLGDPALPGRATDTLSSPPDLRPPAAIRLPPASPAIEPAPVAPSRPLRLRRPGEPAGIDRADSPLTHQPADATRPGSLNEPIRPIPR